MPRVEGAVFRPLTSLAENKEPAGLLAVPAPGNGRRPVGEGEAHGAPGAAGCMRQDGACLLRGAPLRSRSPFVRPPPCWRRSSCRGGRGARAGGGRAERSAASRRAFPGQPLREAGVVCSVPPCPGADRRWSRRMPVGFLRSAPGFSVPSCLASCHGSGARIDFPPHLPAAVSS